MTSPLIRPAQLRALQELATDPLRTSDLASTRPVTVGVLLAKDWVRRSPHGRFTLTDAGADMLTELHRRSVQPKANPALDMIGKSVGVVTVLSRAGNDAHGNARFVCSCSRCGRTDVVLVGFRLRDPNMAWKKCTPGCREIASGGVTLSHPSEGGATDPLDAKSPSLTGVGS